MTALPLHYLGACTRRHRRHPDIYMKDTIISLLEGAVDALKHQGVLPNDLTPTIKVDPTKDKAHGDYATNLALMLAKPSGMKPRELADTLVAALPASDAIQKTEIAGPGFINFFAATDAAAQIVAQVLDSGDAFGRSLIGIKESTTRMHAIGSPVHLRLVQVYSMSAAIAGVAGGLFAQANAYLTTQVLSFGLSGDVLIMVILGGAGQLYGAFLGATAFLLLERQTELVLGTEFPYWQLAVGTALVLTVLSGQNGLLGMAITLYRRLRGRTS